MTFLSLAQTSGNAVEVNVLQTRMKRYFELPDRSEGGMADLRMGLDGDAQAAGIIPAVEVDNSYFSSVIGGADI
jgi:hypothetical protein